MRRILIDFNLKHKVYRSPTKLLEKRKKERKKRGKTQKKTQNWIYLYINIYPANADIFVFVLSKQGAFLSLPVVCYDEN